MWIVVVGAVVAILVAPWVRRLIVGHRFLDAHLTGQYDSSKVGRIFAEWVDERPERTTQRQIFVQVAAGLGAPRGIVGQSLMNCIMQCWKNKNVGFGDVLAQELERLIVFEPQSGATISAQAAGKEAFRKVTTQLRELDTAPAKTPHG